MTGIVWHKALHVERPGAVKVACIQCGKDMWLPPTKVGIYWRCSQECQQAGRAAAREARRRECQTCEKVFYPRTTQLSVGGGRYCSQKCNAALKACREDPAYVAVRVAGRKRAIAEGRFAFKTGEDHHSWTGGREASLQRQRAPEYRAKQAATMRRYRKNNAERIKEWTSTRRGPALGRLPRGTIPRIGAAQKWKCALCRTGIRKKYHVDHIVPLAKGGTHEPKNIQLTCPTCNVRKNAKDQIDFMREQGHLL